MKNKRLTYKLNEQEQEAHKTKYLKFEYFPIPDYCIEKGNYGRISSDMIYNKLGELEDIEEDIDFSLKILYNAQVNGFYGRKGECTTFYNPNTDFVVIDFKLQRLQVALNCDFYNVVTFYFEDYKKTWWLREDKEE